MNREFALGGKIAAFLVQHQMFLKIGELVNLIMMPLDYFAKQIFGRATGLTAAGTTPAALAGSLGRTTIILACFFILLVGAKWGLRLFSSLITRGLDFTLIGAVNHFCGGALSAAATFIILALALLVISPSGGWKRRGWRALGLSAPILWPIQHRHGADPGFQQAVWPLGENLTATGTSVLFPWGMCYSKRNKSNDIEVKLWKISI